MPKPSKDEVLVKVEAASVNPVDWKLQSGAMRFLLPTKFPFTPGVTFIPIFIVLSLVGPVCCMVLILMHHCLQLLFGTLHQQILIS